MSKKLSVNVLVVLLVALTLAGAIFLLYFKQVHENKTASYLKVLAAYLVFSWEADESQIKQDALNCEMAHEQNSAQQLRISLIQRDGGIFYDTLAGNAGQKEASRPEVKAAFHTEDVSSAIRYIDNTRHMYLAAYVPKQDAVVRVSMSLDLPNTVFLFIFAASLLLAALAGAAYSFYISRISRRYGRSLSHIEEGLRNLQDGNYTFTVSEIDAAPYPELLRLNTCLGQTKDVLFQRRETARKHTARLSTILDTILDPLLMVDEDKNLLYVNQEAMQVFGRDLNPEETPYQQILLTHSEELDWLIEESMDFSSEIDTTLLLQTLAGQVRYKTLIFPIYIADEAQGAVISLHDLTIEEQASAFRRDFVANVTHELKTPLTSIRGFIETLSTRNNVSQAQAFRFLEIMDVEAQRLEDLIDDILSLSEIERGKLKQICPFDLSELIDEVIVLLDEQASEKKISLFTEENLPLCLEVEAERDRIKQILINLTENAIKYCHEGCKVSLNAYRLPNNKVQIIVTDNGPGIPEEAQKRIFERFYRVDSSRSRAQGGTGLGLSIVKHIAQLYNGEAEVESSLGKGSRFIVTMEI